MAATSRSLVVIALLGAVACQGHHVASAPEPAPGPVVALVTDSTATVETPAVDSATADRVLADTVVTREQVDSAADQQALNALEELEADSLDKAGQGAKAVETVSGTEVVKEAANMFAEPRGGAASAAGPTYDIDVTSFASHKTVKLYMGFFQRLARDRFEIWLGRMSRYEAMVRSRFAAQGIPEDMVYLGLIESGFSNTAVSRTRAVGMWQFMAGTAKKYGLVVDPWVDERRDPFKATDAAARLLADLNAEFGSWYLAAAAYNGGAGRVSRGLRRLQAADTASDGTFFRLSDKRYLRRETRDYVPKLIAAALIAKTPSRYGFESQAPLSPLQFDEITVSEQTGLDVLARLADTTTAAMLELNPQLFRGVTPPGKPVLVRVPTGTGTVVAQRWTELPAGERVTVIEHIVASGETISGIAKRYHVEQSLIVAANPTARPRVLRIGQRLLIPVSMTARATYASRTAQRAPRRAAVTPVPAAPAVPSAGDDSPYHVIRSGETLWEIGLRYGVKVSDLMRWNGIVPGKVLRIGGRLLVTAPPGAADGGSESPSP